MREAPAAVRPHHDQVGIPVLRPGEDHIDGVAVHQPRFQNAADVRRPRRYDPRRGAGLGCRPDRDGDARPPGLLASLVRKYRRASAAAQFAPGIGDQSRHPLALRCARRKMAMEKTVIAIEDPPLAQALFSDVRWSWIWLVVRLYVGYEWLREGLDKVTSPAWAGAHAGAALSAWLQLALAKTHGAHPDVQ